MSHANNKNNKKLITTLAQQYGWFVLIIFACLYFAYTHLIIQHGDMIHYLGISAYMKSSHQYLFTSNYKGNFYTEKPPLIFWLIAIGWKLFGTNFWWPQLLSGLWISTWIILSKKIYLKVFPSDKEGAILLPWIMICSIGYLCYLEIYRVDHMLITAILLFIYGFICRSPSPTSSQTQPLSNQLSPYLLITLATILGIMSKGPLFFLWTLLPSLGLMFNQNQRKHICFTFIFSFIGLFIVFITWILPVILYTPSDYAYNLLLGSLAHHTQLDSNWHQRLHLLENGFILFLLPWILNIVFLKKIYYSIRDTGHNYQILALLFIPFFIFTFKGNMVWHIAPILPISLIFFTRFIVHFKQHKIIGYFNAIIFCILFLTIGIILIYKCCLLPSNSHFLFHGSMNRPFFTTLAILLLATAVCTIKNIKYFLQFLPIYSLMFFLTYASIQGYGAQRVLQNSKRSVFIQLLKKQIKARRPIIFIEASNKTKFSSSEPSFIFSSINLFELRLPNIYPKSIVLNQKKVNAFFTKHPKSLLVTNLPTNRCPDGLQSLLKLKDYKVYSTTILLCAKPDLKKHNAHYVKIIKLDAQHERSSVH